MKIKKNNKLNNKDELKAENILDTGFSAFILNSENNDTGFSIIGNELKNKEEKETKKSSNDFFMEALGIEIKNTPEELKSKSFKTTKKINKKEAKEFNRKYREKYLKNIRNSKKRESNKEKKLQNGKINTNKSGFVKKSNFPFFNILKKNDILKKKYKNEEKDQVERIIKEEKRKVNSLVKKQKITNLKKKAEFNFKNFKTNLKTNLKKIILNIKEAVLNFLKKNIVDKTNRRKNILNLMVFIPVIILLSINISLIKDIIITNKAINNLRDLQKKTVEYNKEREKLEEELNKLKKE